MPHATAAESVSHLVLGLRSTSLPLVQRRDYIVTSLADANPCAAVSVWAPRTSPAARGTARLRAYNGAFLQAMDSSSTCPLPASMSELFNEETTLKEEEYLQHSIRVAREQLCVVLEGMHEGRFAGAHGVSVLVSSIGRVQYVWLVVIPLFDPHGVLLEWISAMTPLPTAINAPHLKLYFSLMPQGETPYIPHGSLESCRVSPPATPASTGSSRLYNRSQTPNVFVFDLPHMAAREWMHVRSDELQRGKRRSQNNTDFRCAECGASSTP